MIASLVAGLLWMAADPCAAVIPSNTPDPVGASTYRRLAERERQSGSRDAAIAAYRTAAALDRSDAVSRTALDELCREKRQGSDPFSEGLNLMDADDLPGAIAAFQRARARGEDPSAALLEGICHYRLAEYDDAERLLRAAERLPAHADAARFYLGLIAMERGASTEAVSRFESVSDTSGLGPAAADLARFASREGRLILSFLAETNWDSNVTLRPDAAPAAGTSASDAGYAAMANIVYRPLDRSGLFLRATGMLHQQMTLNTYDLGGEDAAIGWELGHGAHMIVVEYDYGYRTLGGASYLSANRLSASGWATVAGVNLSGSYFARFDTYASNWSGFSGVLQRGEVKASRAVGPALRLSVAYELGRDLTRDTAQTWFEHGPSAEALITLSRRARLSFAAGVAFRPYANYDPTLGTTRSDTFVVGSATAEWDLASRWTARVSLLGRRSVSNVPDFTYSKLAPAFGVGYVLGI